MFIFILISLFVYSDNTKSQNPCNSVEYGVPVFDDQNRLQGCKLEKVEPNSLYEKLGLKEGDVVRPSKEDSILNVKNNGVVENIDGKTPSSPQEAMDLYQKAKASKMKQIERNGKKKTSYYKVN